MHIYIHIHIHAQVCSCIYLFPSHSSTGSWQFSLKLLLCIHTHAQAHTYGMYIKTHVLTFRFFFTFCFAYVLLPHSHSHLHTRTRSRQQAKTKTTVTTTTTAIKTIITLLLLRCGTTWVNERTHTCIQTDRHWTHAHACFMAKYNARLYTRALTLYAAPICPGKERENKKERCIQTPCSLSCSSCRRPKIYKQINLNNWTWKLQLILFSSIVQSACNAFSAISLLMANNTQNILSWQCCQYAQKIFPIKDLCWQHCLRSVFSSALFD